MENRKAKITKREVDRATVMPTEYVIWDTELPMFGVRIYPSGTKTFIVQFRVQGRPREAKMTLGRFGVLTAEQARDAAKLALYAAKSGNDPRSKKETSPTFAEAFSAFAKNPRPLHRRTGKPRPLKSFQRDCQRIRLHALPSLGTRQLADITKMELEALRTKISHPIEPVSKRSGRGNVGAMGGPETANRTLAALKSFFAECVDNEIIQVNPATGIIIPATKRREANLSEEQVHFLLARLAHHRFEGKINPKALDIIELLLRTGCRKNEIQGLRWSEVMFQTRTLKLANSKTGERTVVLCDKSLKILEHRSLHRNDDPSEAKSDFVFPATNKPATHFQSADDLWDLLRVEVGNPECVVHSLRHTLASRLERNKASLSEIQKALGHTSMRTTERYVHVDDADLRRALNALK